MALLAGEALLSQKPQRSLPLTHSTRYCWPRQEYRTFPGKSAGDSQAELVPAIQTNQVCSNRLMKNACKSRRQGPVRLRAVFWATATDRGSGGTALKSPRKGSHRVPESACSSDHLMCIKNIKEKKKNYNTGRCASGFSKGNSVENHQHKVSPQLGSWRTQSQIITQIKASEGTRSQWQVTKSRGRM